MMMIIRIPIIILIMILIIPTIMIIISITKIIRIIIIGAITTMLLRKVLEGLKSACAFLLIFS